MKTLAVLSRKAGAGMALAILIAPGVATAADTRVLWMGDVSCGAWPRFQAYEDLGKAALLNWVLGFLSGRAMAHGSPRLKTVTQASISLWLDNYCVAHPLDQLPTAALALEHELDERISPAPQRPKQ